MAVGCCLLVTWAATASGKDKDKETGGPVVDSGTFGVFMNGVRVATENFSIHQLATGSVVSSEFKSDKGADKALQSSELRLNPTGDLHDYEWKETSPGKVRAVVTPSESFLIERVTTSPDDKAEERPFLLPASTSILDDYFFVQRELLVWKYLATGCRHEKGPVECPVGQKTQFGSMNPHARTSAPVSVEFAGREKIAIRGAERELGRFDLKSEGTADWSVWVDDQFKIVRILIPGENTEVVRD
jgi:hypothetical protein